MRIAFLCVFLMHIFLDEEFRKSFLANGLLVLLAMRALSDVDIVPKLLENLFESRIHCVGVGNSLNEFFRINILNIDQILQLFFALFHGL